MQDSQFQWLGERRHMTNAPYVLPKDKQEINRLDFQHYMLRYALQGNYTAPITQPATILDVGCGSGRWATEMATIFPNTQVTGFDLVDPKLQNAAQQNAESSLVLPNNFTFIQGNILEALPFPNDTFDFVHMQLLLFAIPSAHWLEVLRELIRVTRIGGWIESVETGPQQTCGPAMDQLVQWITSASYRRGIDPLLGPSVGKALQTAGLAQIHTHSVMLPIGKYGGRLGLMAQTDIFSVVKSVKQIVVAHAIASAAAYDTTLAEAHTTINQYKGKLPFYIAYGQRS